MEVEKNNTWDKMTLRLCFYMDFNSHYILFGFRDNVQNSEEHDFIELKLSSI